jgi:hypothetical protein
MPAYSTSGAVTSIAPGDSVAVWNAETPVAGDGGASASQQIALTMAQAVGNGIAFDGQFSGAPGAFEVDCQVAQADSDAAYQTIASGNVTAVDAVNNTFHVDAPGAVAKFARMLMRSRANDVSITGRITQR